MSSVIGRVLLVQEGRFELLSDNGQGHIFLLAPGSGVEADDLAALQRRQARVLVQDAAAPGLTARVAKHIKTLEEAA